MLGLLRNTLTNAISSHQAFIGLLCRSFDACNQNMVRWGKPYFVYSMLHSRTFRRFWYYSCTEQGRNGDETGTSEAANNTDDDHHPQHRLTRRNAELRNPILLAHLLTRSTVTIQGLPAVSCILSGLADHRTFDRSISWIFRGYLLQHGAHGVFFRQELGRDRPPEQRNHEGACHGRHESRRSSHSGSSGVGGSVQLELWVKYRHHCEAAIPIPNERTKEGTKEKAQAFDREGVISSCSGNGCPREN